MKAILNGVILAQEGEVRDRALLFDDQIRGIVMPSDINGAERIDAEGRYVAPGLIDLHIHGYQGEDASDGEEAGLRRLAESLLPNGVTAFLPTTMTLAWPDIERAIAVIRDLMPQSMDAAFPGAQILGCHAEGPFISPAKKGAQAAEHILPPDAAAILRHRDVVRLLTLAPEMPGGLDTIRQIVSSSDMVVAIGHSEASYEEATAAIEAGASYITHLFNGMPPLHHRNPGVVGAALTRDVYCELIADGFHVHSGLFALLQGIKGDKLVLISDCTRAGGLPDGTYSLGGRSIHVKGITCRLADGTIAGSVLRLNHGVRHLYLHGGLSRLTAVHAASLNPARALGIDDRKGSIRAGKDADLILMDDGFEVSAAYIGGRLKYQA